MAEFMGVKMERNALQRHGVLLGEDGRLASAAFATGALQVQGARCAEWARA